MLHAMWIFIPALRQPPGFDFFVLFAGIALLLLSRSLRLGNRDESRIDDLATAGLEALGAEVCLKHLEKLLDNFRLAQSLSEESDSSGIWNAVHHTKPDKLLKGAPVIHLEFKLFNRKRKATPTLRLKSCWRTSILKRISGSIRLRPALLFRSCV
jgi:hypothetical protein